MDKPRKKKMGKEREYKKKLDFEIGGNGCFNVTSHKGFGKWPYPKMRLGGEKVLAHRLVYEECFGVIPKGLVVRHKCDNPRCVNPEHLELGTQQDNVNDTIERGRYKQPLSGVNSPKSRFNKEQVIEIYKRSNAGEKMRVLAEEFGVVTSVISNIKHKRKYKEILGELS